MAVSELFKGILFSAFSANVDSGQLSLLPYKSAQKYPLLTVMAQVCRLCGGLAVGTVINKSLGFTGY